MPLADHVTWLKSSWTILEGFLTYHTYQTRSQCEIFKRILKRDSSRASCHRPASPPMAAAVSPEEDLINEWRRKVDQWLQCFFDTRSNYCQRDARWCLHWKLSRSDYFHIIGHQRSDPRVKEILRLIECHVRILSHQTRLSSKKQQ